MRTTKNTLEKKKIFEFSNLDAIGKDFQFKYRTKEKLKTPVGAWLSIFGTVIISYAFFITLKRFFQTNNPNISTSIIISPDYPKINLYDEKLFIAVLALRGFEIFNSTEINRFFTVKGVVLKNDYSTSGEDSSYTQTLELIVNYIPCKDVEDENLISILNTDPAGRNLLDAYGLCPNITKEDKEKFFVSNKTSSPPANFMFVFIRPCSLEDQSKCATAEELKGVNLMLSETEKGLNHSDFKNPTSSLLKMDRFITLKLRNSLDFNARLKKNEIWDDTQDFSEEKLRTVYFDVDNVDTDYTERDSNLIYCPPAEILAQSCQSYVQFQ